MFFEKGSDTYHTNLTTVFQSFSDTEIEDLFNKFLNIYIPESKSSSDIQDRTILKEKFIFYFMDLNSGQTRIIEEGTMLFSSMLGPFMNEEFKIGGAIHTNHEETYQGATKKL